MIRKGNERSGEGMGDQGREGEIRRGKDRMKVSSSFIISFFLRHRRQHVPQHSFPRMKISVFIENKLIVLEMQPSDMLVRVLEMAASKREVKSADYDLLFVSSPSTFSPSSRPGVDLSLTVSRV